MSDSLTMAKLDRYNAVQQMGRVPPWWKPFARRRWIRRYHAAWSVTLDEMTMMYRALYSVDSLDMMASRRNSALSLIRKAP